MDKIFKLGPALGDEDWAIIFVGAEKFSSMYLVDIVMESLRNLRDMTRATPPGCLANDLSSKLQIYSSKFGRVIYGSLIQWNVSTT